MPQQYLGSEAIDCITEAGGFSDLIFNQTCSKVQKALYNPKRLYQKIPSNFYLQQAIRNSRTACYNNKLYLNDVSRKSSIWRSYDESNCLYSSNYECLNKACKFYVNENIPFNSNKHSFLISC